MNKTTIVIAALAGLSIVLFLGIGLPNFPYIRRLSREKADALLQEFQKLYMKNWMNVKDSSLPKLTAEESDRWNKIKLKLIMAGYYMEIDVNETTGQVWTSLEYPKYAQ